MYAYPDIIQYAKICQSLASKDIKKQEMLGGFAMDKTLPHLLYVERKSLEEWYADDPTDTGLTDYANYVLSLCEPYLQVAMQRAGDGGTVVDPTTPTGVSRSLNYKLQFVVGESNSPILAGASSFVLPIVGIDAKSVNVFRDGMILMEDRDDEFSFIPTVTNNYVIITFNEAVYDGYKFIVHLEYTGTTSSSGSSTGVSGLVYQIHTSGSTVTINDATDILIINPATTLAALTVTMPANPVVGKDIGIMGGGTLTRGNVVVTSLSVVANSGQSILQATDPTFLMSGDSLEYLVYTLNQYRRK